jgi:hypothetical protein
LFDTTVSLGQICWLVLTNVSKHNRNVLFKIVTVNERHYNLPTKRGICPYHTYIPLLAKEPKNRLICYYHSLTHYQFPKIIRIAKHIKPTVTWCCFNFHSQSKEDPMWTFHYMQQYSNSTCKWSIYISVDTVFQGFCFLTWPYIATAFLWYNK